jgi:hypothetical protein
VEVVRVAGLAVEPVAVSRWSTHPTVVVECPACGQPLPRIVVDVDALSSPVPSGRRVLWELHVRAQELDAAWWTVARREHPDCIPRDVGVREAKTSSGRHVTQR